MQRRAQFKRGKRNTKEATAITMDVSKQEEMQPKVSLLPASNVGDVKSLGSTSCCSCAAELSELKRAYASSLSKGLNITIPMPSFNISRLPNGEEYDKMAVLCQGTVLNLIETTLERLRAENAKVYSFCELGEKDMTLSFSVQKDEEQGQTADVSTNTSETVE